MAQKLIDLRSDTVTRPSEGMRKAMAAAEVGDDVYREDPTVNRLEEVCADVTGKAAALFVPSGSMANLIAQMYYARPGDEVIIGEGSHCFRYEVGAGAAIAGVQYAIIPGNGLFTAWDVEQKIRARTFHTPGTALVWIENTHNFGGGIIFPLDRIREIRTLCREASIPVHMDGARVFNAAVETQTRVRYIADEVDSLSFCFSKGLGAPVGSVLCGGRAFIDEARRFRKMLGGGMRQAGVLAAAALYALEHNVERLREDHEKAGILAACIAGLPGIRLDMKFVQTNMVMVESAAGEAKAFVEKLKSHGVLANAVTPAKVRFVTHIDVSLDEVKEAVSIIRKIMMAPTIC